MLGHTGTMRIVGLLLLVPFAAYAQVSTDTHALDALKAPAKPAAGAAAVAPQPKRAVTHRATRAPARPARRVVLPAVPAGPPPNPVIAPPPAIMPVHKITSPPPVPVKPDAIGVVSALPDGTRLTFGAGSSDLNPATDVALLSIAAAAHADATMTIGVTAWAPGSNEDPSTPRRLSLDRALAARAVLINAGIPSERILAVAKGFADMGSGPADRVDVIKMRPPSPKAPAPGLTTKH